MASLNSLITDLKFWGRLEPSEGFADPTDLTTIVQKASELHNPAYACSAALFTIPAIEAPLVSTLALSLLFSLRAAKAAQAAPVRTGDFQMSKDSPFEKNSKMAKFYEDKYLAQCKMLDLATYSGKKEVQVSEAVAENMDTGMMTPVEISLEPPFVNLSASTPTAGVSIVSLTTTLFSQFGQRRLFHVTGNESLYQAWNSGSTLFPCVNSSGELLLNTTNQRAQAFKIENMLMTPGTVHRFLVVTETLSGVNGYSNEVVVTVPA